MESKSTFCALGGAHPWVFRMSRRFPGDSGACQMGTVSLVVFRRPLLRQRS